MISDRERLEAIYSNGLCREWLQECNITECTFEEFLILVDGQVLMDREERTEEFQETLRKALAEPMVRILEI